MAAQAETSLQQMVSRLLERLDAMDLDGLGGMVDDEVQGVDEIARKWMRGGRRSRDTSLSSKTPSQTCALG